MKNEKLPTTMDLAGKYPDIADPRGTEERQLLQQLAEKDAELLALRAAHEQFRHELTEFQRGTVARGKSKTELAEIRGVQGTLAVVLSRFDAALAASPPHPETEGGQ